MLLDPQNKNIGSDAYISSHSNAAKAFGYILIALVITLALMLMGICALWCRRNFKKYFIDERPPIEVPEIIAG